MIPPWLKPLADYCRSHWEAAQRFSKEPFAHIAKRWWNSWCATVAKNWRAQREAARQVFQRPLVHTSVPQTAGAESQPPTVNRNIWFRRAIALGVLLLLFLGVAGTARAKLGGNPVPEIDPSNAASAGTLLVGCLLIFFDSIRSRAET